MSRGGDRHHDQGLPKTVEAALAPVPHSAWVAVRYGPERSVLEVVSRPPRSSARELEEIAFAEAASFLRPPLDAVVTTRAPVAPYAHGLTHVGGDQRAITSLVVILRDDHLARFTACDKEAVRRAGEAIAAYVASQPHRAPAAETRVRSRSQPALFTLNEDCEIESAWTPEDQSHERERQPGEPRRLLPNLEAAVRELTYAWDADDPVTLRDGASLDGAYVVRVVPLQGTGGLRLGVTIERLRTRDSLASTAQFRLSARELDVLALLLEGRDTREVAEVLKIAATTASDHVKRMLVKTGSRNRVELVARALGWPRGAESGLATLGGKPKPRGFRDQRGS